MESVQELLKEVFAESRPFFKIIEFAAFVLAGFVGVKWNCFFLGFKKRKGSYALAFIK